MRAPSRREQVFGLIFLVSLVWGVWNYRHLLTAKDFAAQTASQSATPASVAAPAASEVLPASETPETVHASWGSDPFNRPWRMTRTVAPVTPGVVVKKGALKLSAIVVRPDKRYAIINGTIVREGDSVAGRRVTRIESSKVLLDDQGVEVTLTL